MRAVAGDRLKNVQNIECYLKEAKAILANKKVRINHCVKLPGDPGFVPIQEPRPLLLSMLWNLFDNFFFTPEAHPLPINPSRFDIKVLEGLSQVSTYPCNLRERLKGTDDFFASLVPNSKSKGRPRGKDDQARAESRAERQKERELEALRDWAEREAKRQAELDLRRERWNKQEEQKAKERTLKNQERIQHLTIQEKERLARVMEACTLNIKRREEEVKARKGKMSKEISITLYSTTGCCFCKKVADVLDGLGVAYNLAYLDGQASGRHKASLRRRGITILAVPVLIVGEKVYRPPDLIDEYGNVKDTLPSLVGK